MISIIAAMDEKRGIGKENALMWHIPGELPRFKKFTMGHPIIMGRKTFESIGRVLPGRTNIIITSNSELEIKGAIIVNSLEMATKAAENSPGGEEIFIIGGGQIFREAMEKGIVDKLYLTIVEARLDSPPESPARRGDFGADTFFPGYSGFNVLNEEAGQEGDYRFKFLELEREA